MHQLPLLLLLLLLLFLKLGDTAEAAATLPVGCRGSGGVAEPVPCPCPCPCPCQHAPQVLVLILRWEGGRRDAAQRSHKRRCKRGGEAGDSRSSVMRGVSGAHGEEFEQEKEEAYGAVHTHVQPQGGGVSRDQAEPSPGEWQSSAGGSAVQCSIGEAAVL